MNPENLKHHFIEAMAKHLPPSASTLQLIDLDGQAGDVLKGRRADLEIQVLSADDPISWQINDDSVDAVVAFNVSLEIDLLNRILKVMRPGARFMAVLSSRQVSEDYVKLLEKQGYVRILVEPAVTDLGVLIRGEKAHLTTDTMQRIQDVATSDADMLDLEVFKGRYVHLLIHQTPNKPVWKLGADEKIRWQAIAVERNGQQIMLGFSSLPKAVGFMQPAVLDGVIQDINKVGKFSKETASGWEWSVLLNPTLDSIRDEKLILIDIDPDTAEMSDE